jgi:serine/threonine-protein kinase HipA
VSFDVEVRFGQRVVGRLLDVNRTVHFEYAPEFLGSGLELSPFKLPLRPGVFSEGVPEFHGLYGVFFDSLPDGWGLLLMHRRMRERGIDPERVSVLAWLRCLGERGMGALTFHPVESGLDTDPVALDLRELEREAQNVYEGSARRVLPQLELAGGSPGGARPKVVVGLDPSDNVVAGAAEIPDGFEHWLVKFASRDDGPDAGALEEAYAQLARKAGVDVPPTRLFKLDKKRRCFAVRRFDRIGNARVHVHTASGLLHASHRLPSLDYSGVLKATSALTRDHTQVLEQFRRAAFNVLACNRDDHARNFAFLLDEKSNEWRLTPAFDLTPNEGMGGNHTTSILGEALKPTRGHLLALGRQLSLVKAPEALTKVERAVRSFAKVAREVGVSAATVKRVERRLAEVWRDWEREVQVKLT